MRLAAGDHRIIDALHEYRFLQSGQLARITGRSSQVVRRRLRLLAASEFVLLLERRPADQAAYSLGPEGYYLVAQKLGVEVSALPFSRRICTKKTRSPFWRHELRVSDTLIAFDLAAKREGSPAYVSRVIREWELTRSPGASMHHEKFVLSERLMDKGRAHFHRPDACLLLSPSAGPAGTEVAMFLELDRGTESVATRLRQKLEAYRLYAERGHYSLHLGAVGMRVLFVLDCPTTRRLDSLQAELRRLESLGDQASRRLASMVRITRLQDLDHDALTAPIWRVGTKPEPRPLVRASLATSCERPGAQRGRRSQAFAT